MDFNEIPSVKEARAKNEERGYTHLDIEKTRVKVNEERRRWWRTFESHVENLLYHADEWNPQALVEYAEKLTDAQFSLLERRFPEGMDLEDE